MCGRFVILDDKEIVEINAILRDIDAKLRGTGFEAKTGEIFPTNNVPVLALDGGKPALNLMRWGFPRWDNKGVIINARSESVAEKKMFAKPYVERRCVIPSTGFYEWRRDERGKTLEKYLFNVNRFGGNQSDGGQSSMLYMAAVYTEYSDDVPLRERFVILTRAANDSMSDIHDRMPVILQKNELTKWLTDKAFADYILRRDDVELIRQAAA